MLSTCTQLLTTVLSAHASVMVKQAVRTVLPWKARQRAFEHSQDYFLCPDLTVTITTIALIVLKLAVMLNDLKCPVSSRSVTLPRLVFIDGGHDCIKCLF